MATPTFFQKLIFHKIKSESRRSSGDAREKCGSTLPLSLNNPCNFKNNIIDHDNRHVLILQHII